MKQKDIALLVVIAVIAAVISLLLTQTIFVSNDIKKLTAEKVDPIGSDFNTPDKSVFNQDAINPTQLIQIGDNSKTTPL